MNRNKTSLFLNSGSQLGAIATLPSAKNFLQCQETFLVATIYMGYVLMESRE